ncbi:hypothetical protein [Amycolatopsis kentuckyensis]|nr:hypothetical protein [Amycolatopsis kentuckyensis]
MPARKAARATRSWSITTKFWIAVPIANTSEQTATHQRIRHPLYQ